MEDDRNPKFALSGLPLDLISSILALLPGAEFLGLLKVNRNLRNQCLAYGLSNHRIKRITFDVVGGDDISTARFDIGFHLDGRHQQLPIYRPYSCLMKIKSAESMVMGFRYFHKDAEPVHLQIRGPESTEGSFRRFFPSLAFLKDLEINIQNQDLLENVGKGFRPEIVNTLVIMEQHRGPYLTMPNLKIAGQFIKDSQNVEVITEEGLMKTRPFPENRCRQIVLTDHASPFVWNPVDKAYLDIVRDLITHGVPSTHPEALFLLDTGSLDEVYDECVQVCAGYDDVSTKTKVDVIHGILNGFGRQLQRDLFSIECAMFKRRIDDAREVLLIISKEKPYVLAKNVPRK